MAVLSRSAWTTAKNQAPAIKRDQTEIYLHYPGQPGAIGRASQAATAQRLRNYRLMHTRGQYSEIAYNWAVDQDGRIWELRGKRQCGGNGGQTTNRRGQAILVLTGNTEQPTEDCIRGINECIAMIRDWQPTARTIRGHRESFEASTVCPGEPIMRLIKAGAFTGNVAQSVPEAVKDAARPWRDSPRVKGMDAGVVKSVQKLLGVTDDGIYGDKTGTAVAAVQAELGLTPDGVWGPATEVAMSKLEEKIDRAIAIVTENQRRINEVREQTSGIRRGGKDVSLRQEIADAKTLALSAEARDRAILESVQAAASSGQPVDLEAVTAAAERGVAAAVSGLTADVTLTVDKA